MVSGDTLYNIAQQFSMTVQELKKLNNLSTDILQLGQQLLVYTNTKPISPTNTYIVQKGDTLYSIASIYGISVQELKGLNNLTSNTLYIGEQLLVPSIDVSPPEEQLPPSQDYQIYTVKKGDSLWSISKKFNITIPELVEINNLKNYNLQIGDELKVPLTEQSKNTYTVKSGDTLWSIAKENNISISELKEANNLETNLLSIGQQLIIP
ncbi:MAG: LysM peptidoglycan-binding domain-containing protein [bacterium]|nr:LysM peptidoglycan-binding domain-containing protein [bacterium]